MPILVRGRLRETDASALLGFAAGVMLAASFFSLIVPALASAGDQGLGRLTRSSLVTAGVLAGASGLAWLNASLPPLGAISGSRGSLVNDRNRSTWLMIIAITLHNFPEGAAVGLSFADGTFTSGMPTALGIGIQNVPEGLAVAGALATIGYGRTGAALGGLASGLVEPLAGLAAACLVTAAKVLLPAGLALAAGAMLYIVVAQIIPDLKERGATALGTKGFFLGLGLMLFLDTALG
ncbi:ZIP family metal transporter [Novosphingobium resinovorum]|uniref:ZIP family metal transporter n=1 Tax=Novosphingobium TaxID=165696 RepID=UPI0020044FA8|nr:MULTISPECIES: ZIP family metal transporter [Novosphingobium]WJM26008.1 ZIP family metal transporter [Novosphingobium resinovorum]